MINFETIKQGDTVYYLDCNDNFIDATFEEVTTKFYNIIQCFKSSNNKHFNITAFDVFQSKEELIKEYTERIEFDIKQLNDRLTKIKSQGDVK